MISQAMAPLDADLPARKESLDVSRIFLAYLATCGDVAQTADIAMCKIADVLFLARTEMWDQKLSESQLSRGPSPEKAKDRAREVNRMANYIQAIRLRALIDKSLQWIYENEENVHKFCSEVNKQGNRVFSTKPVLDLAKAAETVQGMTYRALGDVVADEAGPGSLGSIKELHLHVIDAMRNSEQAEPELKLAEKALKTDTAKQTIGYLDVGSALDS
jgi:hypothetical protein